MSESERRGRTTGFAVMGRSSLSRWENGHVIPDRHYRRLLRDIYGLTDAEPGFASATVMGVEQDQAAGELRGRVANSTQECSGLARCVRRSQTAHGPALEC